MTMDTVFPFATTLAILLILFFGIKSLQNLAPERKDNPRSYMRVLFMGAIAGRSYFTEKGWRYVLGAYAVAIAWFFFLIIVDLLSS